MKALKLTAVGTGIGVVLMFGFGVLFGSGMIEEFIFYVVTGAIVGSCAGFFWHRFSLGYEHRPMTRQTNPPDGEKKFGAALVFVMAGCGYFLFQLMRLLNASADANSGWIIGQLVGSAVGTIFAFGLLLRKPKRKNPLL